MDHFATARRNMVEGQVRANDVTDRRLQSAMETIPRELFLPAELRARAYVERELEYAPGRRLIAPRDFAKLAHAAAIAPGEVVLDVACGTGYSTAVLASLCEMVVGVEADEALAGKAQENLETLGVANAAVIAADPTAGAPSQGPFDVVFIAGAIAVEPAALLEQLKDGGRLAAIRHQGGVSRGVVWLKTGGAIAARAVFDAAARDVLPEFAAPKSFVF